jgi:hypothetical protein
LFIIYQWTLSTDNHVVKQVDHRADELCGEGNNDGVPSWTESTLKDTRLSSPRNDDQFCRYHQSWLSAMYAFDRAHFPRIWPSSRDKTPLK